MIVTKVYRNVMKNNFDIKCPFCFIKVLQPVNNYNVKLVSQYSEKNNNLIPDRKTNDPSSLQTRIETIKETTKTASYLTILIAGFGVGAVIIYAIVSELFSSKSPNAVYSKAFKYVSKDARVTNKIGEHIKGFGEENRRGRRQHVSHVLYKRGDSDCIRMKFYIKGSRGSGTVYLEMMEDEKKQFIYRYLFVLIDDSYKNMITIEDNRHLLDNVSQSSIDLKNEFGEPLSLN